MVIILIGYMGSGKTSVGKALAARLNYSFLDLDDFIEEQEGKTVPEIFASKGEIYFRKKEHQCLQALLDRDHLVLSLGGGTPCYGDNMQRVLQAPNAQSIYLKSSIPQLVERLRDGKAQRPLIAHLENDGLLAEFIGKHLFERTFFYDQSRHTLSTNGKTVAQIVEEISSLL